MKKFIDSAFKHWQWITAASVVLTIISIYFLSGIKIDNSIETLTIDNDPKLLLLQQMEAEYGGNEFVVISFKGEDIFSPNVLKMIQDITLEIEQIKNIEKVLSLTNAYIVKDSEDGFGLIPLVPEDYLQVQDVEKLKHDVISNALYNRWLYSEDGNTTAIIAWIAPVGKDDAARWKVVSEIQKVIDKKKDQREFYIFGIPVYQKDIFDAMTRDQVVLTAMLSILVMLLLYYLFRDIRLVFIPFILVGLSGVWALGLLVMSGSSLNFATFIIPIVVLIVCLCDSVHIMSQYRETGHSDTNHIETIKHVVVLIGTPIMLTSLTTAVGFFSLGISHIKPVRDFGIFTGVGVLFAFIISVTLLPMIMSIMKLKDVSSEEKQRFALMEKILSRISAWIPRNKWIIMAFSMMIIVISLIGMSEITVRQDILDTLKNNAELEKAQELIDKHMSGSCEFNVSFKGDHPYAVLEPENLEFMARIQARLTKEVPEVLKCVSVVDFFKEMNQAVNENNPAYYQLPSTKEDAINLLEIYDFDEDKADLNTLINSDYSQAKIRMFTISADNSVSARKAFNSSEKIIFSESDNTKVAVDFTGRPVIFLDMVDSLIFGMLESFSLAFVAIFILMVIVFRSLGTGILSTIVNIFPAVLTFGMMGWLNIPLNMLTAMVPSVAIGIAVDDTIHFVWRFERELRYDGDYAKAICRTLQSVGKPIITTSILICVGFSVFYFSKLTNLTEFGIITITTVVGALLADLLLGPALLLIFRPIKIRRAIAE